MEKVIVYGAALVSAFLFTLVLTPLVRALNRTLGMVDKPDPRRINKIPIPRGGGIALFMGVQFSVLFMWLLYGKELALFANSHFHKMAVLAAAMCIIGLADDKFSLPPKVKLLGQILVAVLAWAWGGVGFRSSFPSLPAWLDAFFTVFWIVGAVNAFNLIDGLDGLASGLALIATIGMGGSLFFLGLPDSALFYFIFAGGLLGFLRYNYNPASIFLGDSGSMYIGFVIAVLPLCTHQAGDSFLVSVGVPLLAMGVPIFDTSLAIVRRSIRRLILRNSADGAGRVMTADSDHLHHRILRTMGLNQKKTAWTLYAFAAFLVGVGLLGMILKSRAGGLWLLAITIATIIIFKDIYRVELFDAGRLLNSVARDHTVKTRRKVAMLAVPIYIACDVIALSLISLVMCWMWARNIDVRVLRTLVPIRVFSVFACLAFFKTYRTIWSRAMLSNYLRLFVACFIGSMIGGAIIYYISPMAIRDWMSFNCGYALASVLALSSIRMVRIVLRDLLYAIDSARLVGRKDVSRILVYGSGLRYRSFRRELVRTATANSRIIVGILDDDLLLKGKYIGGIQIKGTLLEAPEIINRLNVDSVVIACEIDGRWMKVVKDTLGPTGVKVSYFNLAETEIM